MNPNATKKDDCNIRNSTAIPSHGSIPKWLKDITESIEESHTSEGGLSNKMARPTQASSGIMYSFMDSSLNSGDIPSRIPTYKKMEDKFYETDSSRDFGSRSSLASHMYINNASKNIFLSSTDYLLPKLGDEFDFNEVGMDSRQRKLEKSWRSLSDFKKTHKGRLDSAKNFTPLEEGLGGYEQILSPFSTESDPTPIYNPSFSQPQSVPKRRSNSVLSNYVPLYVYENIKKVTEPRALNKSRSSESIAPGSCNENYPAYSDSDYFRSNEMYPESKYDSSFKKKMLDYQMKIMREQELRQQIINELLVENEKIVDNLKRRSSDTEKYLKTTSSDDFPAHRKLYHRNSKYKSRMDFRKDLYEPACTFNHRDEYDEKPDDGIFIIPELPAGKKIVIDILSTWGDKYYVGLNGIEIFSDKGNLIEIDQISAVPPDVNILPECQNDPRVVSNLLDGINRTQDDMHIWLAPFDPGCSHIITIEFKEVNVLAMMRIWNYNKSRIHSYRGVRDIIILLDGITIFRGEIAKASGGILGGVHTLGDTILFTTDERILEEISKNDTSYSTLTSEPELPTGVDRPLTSAKHSEVSETRPFTGQVFNETPATSELNEIFLGANRIDLGILTNWGHPNIVGLTAVEILRGGDVLHLERNTISCNVERKNIFMNRLINGKNITTDAKHMWSTIYKVGEEIVISFDLKAFNYISGVRIWNYNESLQKSYAGVKEMKIYLDGKPVVNLITGDEIFILRRAPGNQHYDYVQEIKFTDSVADEKRAPSIVSKDEEQILPTGFVVQIIIYSTWSDQYYCGLNGIEIYDQDGKLIYLDEQNICAYPESINALPNIQGDVRTPEKLIDRVNDDHTGLHSWLAPVIPKHLNKIYVVMDQQITISYIKIWNYSKDPSRGVKDFGVLIDDLLVYTGTLQQYNFNDTFNFQSILFTENEQILGNDRDILIRNSNLTQDTILLNEETTAGIESTNENDPELRPYTSVSHFNRKYSSHSH